MMKPISTFAPVSFAALIKGRNTITILKMAIYCPQGSGTLRQQLLTMHGIAWYFMVLHGIAWYCIVLHSIVWYCILLHGIAWYCMVLHGIA